MGNKPKPDPKNDNVTPHIIDPSCGGGSVSVDDSPTALTWTVVLEDLTERGRRLESLVRVRTEAVEPRIRVYVGRELVGFVPGWQSDEIRTIVELRGCPPLQGQIQSVSGATVTVILSVGGW